MLYNILFSKSREFASFIAVRVAEGEFNAIKAPARSAK